MSGLLDIGPLTETVTLVRGEKKNELIVHGITAEGFFYMMQRFPEIRLMMERRANEITPERLMAMAPPTIAFVIGCGLVDPGDDTSTTEWQLFVSEQAKIARKLSVSEQLKFIMAIFKLTFSEGVSPFVDQLAVLMGVSPMASQTTTDGAQDTQSPDTLSASLVGGGMRRRRGAPPPDNSQHGQSS